MSHPFEDYAVGHRPLEGGDDGILPVGHEDEVELLIEPFEDYAGGAVAAQGDVNFHVDPFSGGGR